MTSIDEVLATMSDADIIGGEDYPFQYVIDNDLRVITVPSNGVVLGVENDKDVNLIKFKMPRYYKKLDLSDFNVRINYVNAKAEPGYFTVENKTVDEDSIVFGWLVSAHAAMYMGSVQFAVTLTKLNDTLVDKKFNTTIGKANVLDGLSFDGDISDEEIKDLLAQILDDVMTGITPTIEEAKQAAKDAAASAEKAEVAQTAAETAQTAAETAQTASETAQTAAELAQAKAEESNAAKEQATHAAQIAQETLTKAPYIGDNNHWFTYSNGVATDTGIEARGEKGSDGAGVVAGGTTGQVLAKKSDDDYDTEWVDNIPEPEPNENILKATKSEAVCHVDDAWPTKLLGLKVYGNTVQPTTTGANIFDISKIQSSTFNGITATVNSNGSITFTGTNTASSVVNFDLRAGLGGKDFVLPTGKYISTISGVSKLSLTIQLADGMFTTTTTTKVIDNKTDQTLTYFLVQIPQGATVNETIQVWFEKGEKSLREPYTGGKPSPSPEYPQKFTSVTNDIGNNLIPGLDGESNNEKNGEYPWGYSISHPLELTTPISPGEYCISIESKYDTEFNAYTLYEGEQNFINIAAMHYKTNLGKRQYAFFTLDKPVTKIGFYINKNRYPTYSVSKLMINSGRDMLPYEPYEPINVPKIVVAGQNLINLTSEDYVNTNNAATYLLFTNGIKVNFTREYSYVGFIIRNRWGAKPLIFSTTMLNSLGKTSKVEIYGNNKRTYSGGERLASNREAFNPKHYKWIYILFYANPSNEVYEGYTIFNNISLEVAEKSNVFKPYVEPVKIPIDLKGNELRNIKKVRDILDVTNGTIIKNVEKFENITFNTNMFFYTSDNKPYVNVPVKPFSSAGLGTESIVYCDKYPYVKNMNGSEGFGCYRTWTSVIFFNTAWENAEQAIEELTAANPTVIYHAPRTVIPLGKIDIPSLPETISNVWTNSNIYTDTEIEYVRDVNVAFGKLESAIAANALDIATQ